MEKNKSKHGPPSCFAGTASQGKRAGDGDSLIPKHGGYEHTKTWQLADLIYDVTVRFCDKYVDRRSRTHDQMVQAARSGCQNLQEGSVDSAVSKKIEMKLTGIAKGSLEELRRDYKKFLQHRELPEWPPHHSALTRFKARRCATLKEFRFWVAGGGAGRRANEEHGQTQPSTDKGKTTPKGCPWRSMSVRVIPVVPGSLRRQWSAFPAEPLHPSDWPPVGSPG